MRKRKTAPALDRGDTTPERLARAGQDGSHGELPGQDHYTDAIGRRWIVTPIGKAAERKAISNSQFLAAVKYYGHWYRGGMAGNIGSSELGGVSHANVINFSHLAKTEQQAHDRDQYRFAVHSIGQMGAAVLDHVVCREMTLSAWGAMLGWSRKNDGIVAATQQLRDALLTLCRIWRI